MLRMLRDFWTNRKLIWKLAKNDFKTRYAGSYFGVVWAMVQPVVIVLVYWFVFQIGLNNATAELKQGITVPFVLWLVSGIVPWFYFSESLSNGTNALLEYNYLAVYAAFVCTVWILSGTAHPVGGLFQRLSDDLCDGTLHADQFTGDLFP